MRGCSQKGLGTHRSECSVLNCKIRRDNSHSITSKYCKKHTCEHFSSPGLGGPRCDKSKEPWDSVCSDRNCNRARLQFLLSAGELKYKREKYCDKHKCSVEGCAELRSTLGQQPFQYRPYCNDHACQENGCLERHMNDFNVCENHKCNIRGCPAPKRHSRRFCDNHNRCGWNGCTGIKEENQDFCSIHLQCETLGCRVRKAPNSRHCEQRGSVHIILAKEEVAYSQKPQEGYTCVTLECGKERVFSELCEVHYGEKCRAVAREGWEEDRQRMEDERVRNRNIIIAQDRVLRERDEEINRLRSWNRGPPPN
ncbi:hypothetical protein K449DRAFT_437018 [Hypoxylon sp. EC38]|nr:hypothetical protein K449DRAFT_437018 [Hypoxylon sp. EC38]